MPANLHRIDGRDRGADPHPLGVRARACSRSGPRGGSVQARNKVIRPSRIGALAQSQSCFGAIAAWTLWWTEQHGGRNSRTRRRASRDPCSLSRFLVPPGEHCSATSRVRAAHEGSEPLRTGRPRVPPSVAEAPLPKLPARARPGKRFKRPQTDVFGRMLHKYHARVIETHRRHPYSADSDA
jgi:hypothetical protein